MKGAEMRLSGLALSLGGVVVLSLAILVGVSSAHSSARAGQVTLKIATVNNGHMIEMQKHSADFEKVHPDIKLK